MTGYCGTCRVHFTTLEGWADHQHPPVQCPAPRRNDMMAMRDERVEAVLRNFTAEYVGLSIEDIAHGLEISPTGARRALFRLRDAGRARSVGAHPALWIAS